MKEYKFKYMTDAMVDEINELMKGEHAEALTACFKEYGNAAVVGFKRNVALGAWRGLVYGCALVGAIDIIQGIVTRRKKRKGVAEGT